jgi:hypothetical protein
MRPDTEHQAVPFEERSPRPWTGLSGHPAPELGIPRGDSFQQTIIVRKVNGADALDQAGKEFAVCLASLARATGNGLRRATSGTSVHS